MESKICVICNPKNVLIFFTTNTEGANNIILKEF